MHFELLDELVIIFLLSIVVNLVCNKIKLTATVGFLLTGVLCGPSLLGIVDSQSISDVAELGVAMLLFTIGILIAVGFHAVAWKLVLVLVLQWLTSPLSSHMLSMFEYRADENLGQHLDLSDAEYHTEDEEVAAK